MTLVLDGVATTLPHALLALDASLVGWIQGLRTPALDVVMLAATELGRRGVIWLLIGGVVAVARPARLGGLWQLLLALIICAGLVDAVLKPAVARARPFGIDPTVEVLGDRPTTYAFPSGHAATAFAGALLVGRLWRRGRSLLWGLATIIALSRVYLGVHFPSDIVAGALAGLAIAWMASGGAQWDEPIGP